MDKMTQSALSFPKEEKFEGNRCAQIERSFQFDVLFMHAIEESNVRLHIDASVIEYVNISHSLKTFTLCL